MVCLQESFMFFRNSITDIKIQYSYFQSYVKVQKYSQKNFSFSYGWFKDIGNKALEKWYLHRGLWNGMRDSLSIGTCSSANNKNPTNFLSIIAITICPFLSYFSYYCIAVRNMFMYSAFLFEHTIFLLNYIFDWRFVMLALFEHDCE